MFDAAYFRTHLQNHVKAAGANPTVDLQLVTGQAQRLRSVIEAADGYVVLDVYQRRSEVTGANTAWQGDAPGNPGTPMDTHRAIVAYEGISQIVITATEAGATTRIGFGARVDPSR